MLRWTRTTLLAAITLTGSAGAQQPAPPGPLSLVDAIRLGEERGLSAISARRSAMAGKARALTRFGELLPNISTSARLDHQTTNLDETGIPQVSGTTDPYSVFRFQARISQTLLDAASFTRFTAAKESALAGALDAGAAAQFAGADAGLAWLRMLSARETVRAREADSVVAASLLDQARQSVTAGVSPGIDVTRSEVSFTSVLTQLEVARNSLDRTRLDLLRVLDYPATAPIELDDREALDGGRIPPTADSAARMALANRADLAAEHTRTVAARSSARAIRREQLPSITAGASITQSGTSTSSLSNSYALSVAVSTPIFDGFQRKHRAIEQDMNAEIGALRERDLAMQVETEARQALLDVASAKQQIRIATDRVRLAEKELHEAEQRFAAGVAGSVETTNAQGALISARDALIQARVNHGSAHVTAYRALGLLGSAPAQH